MIKVDYFSDFGNQNELLRLTDFAVKYKYGDLKQIDRSEIDGTPLEPIFKKYAKDTKKDGSPAKRYTILDIDAIMEETEQAVKSIGFKDLDDNAKVRNFIEIMGYAGFMTGNESDRRKLYVISVRPLKRKSDGVKFGYNVQTRSIGSGIESFFTVVNSVFEKDPIRPKDIVYIKDFVRQGKYFRMNSYKILR